MASQLLAGKNYIPNSDGTPMVGGMLYTYDVGTTNPRTTWADQNQNNANSNPVVLNARGEALIFWSGDYTVVLQDQYGNLVWSVDHVNSNAASIYDNYLIDSGALNAYAVTGAQAITTYTAGLKVALKAGLSNTGAATFNYNGVGALPIFYNGAAVTSGQIQGGSISLLEYDGTNWELLNSGVANYPITLAEGLAGIAPASLQYQTLDLRRYGFSTSNSGAANLAAFNQAIAVSVATGTGTITAAPGTYPMLGPVNIDTNHAGFDGRGCTLLFSSNTTTDGFAPINSATDVNQRSMLNCAHPIRNFTLQGPGQQNTVCRAMYLNDSINTAFPCLAGISIENVGYQDWGIDVYFGNGAFCITHKDCSFGGTSAGSTAAPTTYSIQQPSSTNSGERNTFINCGIYNKPLGINCTAGSNDIYWIGGSLDYMQTCVYNGGGGGVFIQNTHIESNTDVANWFYATGGSAVISISGGLVSVTGNKNVYDLAWSDPSNTTGGVFMDNIYFGCAVTMTTRLIGGGGNCKVGNIRQFQNGARPVISTFTNKLAYGSMENANWANDWTLTGTAARSNAQNHTSGGSYSLSFPITAATGAGSIGTAVRSITCSPGQYVNGEIYMIAPALGGTGVTFYCSVAYADAAGVSIGGASIFSRAAVTVSSWSYFPISITTPAPSGTSNATLTIGCYLSGTYAPNGVGYVDDVIFQTV